MALLRSLSELLVKEEEPAGHVALQFEIPLSACASFFKCRRLAAMKRTYAVRGLVSSLILLAASALAAPLDTAQIEFGTVRQIKSDASRA